MDDEHNKKIEKIVGKLYSIALTQLLDDKPPLIKISVFKHLICGYKFPKKDWYPIVKEIERMGIAKFHRNHYLQIKPPQEALAVACKLRDQAEKKVNK